MFTVNRLLWQNACSASIRRCRPSFEWDIMAKSFAYNRSPLVLDSLGVVPLLRVLDMLWYLVGLLQQCCPSGLELELTDQGLCR